MFRVLVVLFLMFSMNSAFAGNVRSRVKVKNKKSKTEFSFTYQSVWYSKLSKKQKRVYFNTLKKLVVNLSKVDKKSVEFKQLQDLFIEKAYAAISNGFVYNSNADRPSARATKEAYGEFWRDCPSGTSLCALYMGLDSNGKGMCANDSTPSCVGDTSALNRKINECDGNSSDRCALLRRTLADGTKNVSTYCNAANRRAKSYCMKAKEQLEKARIPSSPSDISGIPEGENCSDVSKRVKDSQMGKMDKETRGGISTASGDFWGNMVGAAVKACPDTDASTLRQRLGSCSLPANLTSKKFVQLMRGDKGFDECFQDRITGKDTDKTLYQLERERIFEQARVEKWTPAKRQFVLEEAKNKHDALVNRLNTKGCQSEKETLTSLNDLKEYQGAGLDAIYTKLGKGESLTTKETGLFHRATGMTVDGFKYAFCGSKNHDNFKYRLAQKLGFQPRVLNAIESEGAETNYQIFLGQINAGKRKMLECKNTLKKSSTNNDCDYHKVTGLFNISKVNTKGPYVAERDGKCLMVTEMRKETVTTDGRGADGTRNTRMEYSFLASIPGEEDKILVMTPSELSRAYNIKTFACKSKTNLNITGCEVNPEKVDDYNSLSNDCKEVYDHYNNNTAQ